MAENLKIDFQIFFFLFKLGGLDFLSTSLGLDFFFVVSLRLRTSALDNFFFFCRFFSSTLDFILFFFFCLLTSALVIFFFFFMFFSSSSVFFLIFFFVVSLRLRTLAFGYIFF